MTGRAMWIQFGMLLGIIMWFNVWFVIWPRQKQILGGMAAGTPAPRRRQAGGDGRQGLALQHLRLGPDALRHGGRDALLDHERPGAASSSRVIGLGFWFGMIKRSFKVKTTV